MRWLYFGGKYVPKHYKPFSPNQNRNLFQMSLLSVGLNILYSVHIKESKFSQEMSFRRTLESTFPLDFRANRFVFLKPSCLVFDFISIYCKFV